MIGGIVGVCDAWGNMAETVGSRDAIEKAVVAAPCGEVVYEAPDKNK